jgi:hypothetical protein
MKAGSEALCSVLIAIRVLSRVVVESVISVRGMD